MLTIVALCQPHSPTGHWLNIGQTLGIRLYPFYKQRMTEKKIIDHLHYQKSEEK